MADFRQRRFYVTMNINHTKDIKLKLAALAKDEGAYLPEWIFHHLAFGVDEIEVYVNNTTDNSVAILDRITQHHPVKITQADKLLKSLIRKSYRFFKEGVVVILVIIYYYYHKNQF